MGSRSTHIDTLHLLDVKKEVSKKRGDFEMKYVIIMTYLMTWCQPNNKEMIER